MKFSQALKGKRAERKLSFPIPAEGGGTRPLECVCVPLSATEEAEALEYARTFAKKKGVEPELARSGDPIYDLGYFVKVVLLSIRDPDVGVPGDRPPTFADEAEVHSLTREMVVYLYTIVEGWCDECSPLQSHLSDAAIVAGMRALAKEGDDGARFFVALGPALQLNFTRILARQLLALLEPSSPPGTPPTTDTTEATTSSSSSASPPSSTSK